MGDETDKKILDMLAVIDTDLHGLHNQASTPVAGNGFMKPEILIALLLPLVSLIGVYVDINTRLVKIEERAIQHKAERVRVHETDMLLGEKIAVLTKEVDDLDEGLTDLTASNSQMHLNTTRRLRTLEGKVNKND